MEVLTCCSFPLRSGGTALANWVMAFPTAGMPENERTIERLWAPSWYESCFTMCFIPGQKGVGLMNHTALGGVTHVGITPIYGDVCVYNFTYV